MPGDMEKLFSITGRIYVLLRRETNRMIDVEWMVANAVYAREVIRLVREAGHAELMELAERVEQTHPLMERVKSPPPVIVTEKPAPQESRKYVNTLR